MTPEGKVKSQVKRLLNEYGVWHFMPVPTGYGARGIPDFVACCRGTFLAVETKADARRKPTPFQERQLARIRDAGGIALVIHAGNISALEDVLRSLTEGDDDPA